MADEASIHRIPTETAAFVGDPVARKRLEAVREWRKPVPEAEAPIAPKAPPAEKLPGFAAANASLVKPKRRLMRPLLFALLPLALIAGGYFFVTGGQIMSTDNAYVQADMVGVSTDVPGTVVAIDGCSQGSTCDLHDLFPPDRRGEARERPSRPPRFGRRQPRRAERRRGRGWAAFRRRAWLRGRRGIVDLHAAR